ncbi:hypothetical protein PCCS19_11170 [Paenibacillus sp. CCS19]|uniref:AraC family transcriptional regulator n=1 Tax=Paenibacillus sp. CCS19 TaxID=3158387 RepID=UPI0025641751|nr:AraC family transcriptional regulator [Paenibacillus cellulosilyticus]GMK38063.1 hypothetical protein PCCS19_11170 [Paenibacillus cellulosilyticus]
MNSASPNPVSQPYPYAIMAEKMNALELLDLHFTWGCYEIRVLNWHLATFKPGLFIKFHKHAEFEFHFVPRGKGTVTIVDQTFKLSTGMFYLTGPGVVHQQTADARHGMDELSLRVEILRLVDSEAASMSGGSSEWERKEAEACVQTLIDFPHRPMLDQYEAMPCFLQAYLAWQSGELGAYTTIRQCLIQILIRAAKATVNSKGQQLMPSRDIQEHRYEMAIQYIHANYSSLLTLQEVADRIQISSRQLQRILKKYGIDSFSGYLEQYRIQRICDELAGTTNTVESIATRNGFANTNYLYQVFKRRYGITPLEYRQQHAVESVVI